MDLGRTQRLIARALDSKAAQDVGDLLEHLRPRLVLWASAQLSPALRAKLEPEDVAQEALFEVYRDLDSFQGKRERFLSWVFTIGRNTIRDLADHHNAKKRQPLDPRSFSQTSPSHHAAVREQVQRLRRAIEGLPDAHREVVRLRRLEELEVAQVAEIMGRTPNAVRILYCRAIKSLGGALGEDGRATA